MNRVRVSQKLPWGGVFSTLTLINKHFIEYFKLKKVVFFVETTFLGFVSHVKIES